jgi:hypothetical protein
MDLALALRGLGVVAALVLLGLVVLVARRRFLQRQGGSFDCSLRADRREHGKGWVFGISRYRDDRIEWFRVFSLSPRPGRVFIRRDLSVNGRRAPEGVEVYAVLADALVLDCTDAGRPVELAMSPEAVMGFLSWLEAAPPGQHMVA